MSQNSKKSTYTLLIAIAGGLLVAKALWVTLEVSKLPKSGEEIKNKNGLKSLYYHYALASKKEKPKKVISAPIKHTVKPHVVKSKPKPKPEKFNKFILTGIYNSSSKKIIALEYLSKSYVLETGESIEGYKFTKLYPTYAIFEKDGKEFKLDFNKKSPQKKSQSNIETDNVAKVEKPKEEVKKEKIERAGDTTYIPKNLFNKYKTDMGSIQKSIGVVPSMVDGKLNGFKIRYVKRGSDFEKLGIKRGDIVTAINGEQLNNFKVPLEFFNNLDSITAATLTIKRGNEIKELEYEVR